MLGEVDAAHAALADLREDAVARAGDDLPRAEGQRRGRGPRGTRGRPRLEARQRDDLPGGRRGAAFWIERSRDGAQLRALDDGREAAHELAYGRRRARTLERAQDRPQRRAHLVGVGGARRGVDRQRARHQRRERRRQRRHGHAADEVSQERAEQIGVGGAARRLVGGGDAGRDGPGLVRVGRDEPITQRQGRQRRSVVQELHLAVDRQQDGARRQAARQRRRLAVARGQASQVAERRRDLHGDEHRDVDRKGLAPPAQLLVERREVDALDQLAHEEQALVDEADVVDLHEVAVDAAHDARRLVAQRRHEVRSPDRLLVVYLESAEALELTGPPGRDHLTARAARDRLEQREVAECPRQRPLVLGR